MASFKMSKGGYLWLSNIRYFKNTRTFKFPSIMLILCGGGW